MVSVWATGATADSITLSDGRIIDLSIIPGNGWPAVKLEKARAKLQDMLDVRTPEIDFPPDEEYLTMSDEELAVTYGERVFRDGTDIVVRVTVVDAIFWDEERLILVVRNAK